MYLIIERDFNSDLYAYFENKTQFKKMQAQRGGLRRVSGKCLDDECRLSALPPATYMIIPVIAKTVAIEKLLAAKKPKTRGKINGKKVKVSRS